MASTKGIPAFRNSLMASIFKIESFTTIPQVTIEIANDSSLSAFRYQNLYLSGYWEYRTYKANRLPSLTLDLTPAKYYRYITPRYDSNEDMDVYREQQMFSASGGLSIKQNLDWTGGTFYIDSELDFMRNFGDSKSTQYSSIPVRRW